MICCFHSTPVVKFRNRFFKFALAGGCGGLDKRFSLSKWRSLFQIWRVSLSGYRILSTPAPLATLDEDKNQYNLENLLLPLSGG
ncbi:hypothetical protein L6452_19662 [Arctium lappa]|uniref:Uncharacterized protein n=1 Tax=Arctium lappa TaxID=4217 RepID=A0ACB9BA05_ARCLA|nr:hypothetical protein L6452_19662 [Arctium lappa]